MFLQGAEGVDGSGMCFGGAAGCVLSLAVGPKVPVQEGRWSSSRHFVKYSRLVI